MSAGYDHPMSVEVQNRLKWYILGKHSGHVLSPGVNTEEDCSSSMFIDIEDVRFKNTAETSDFIWDNDMMIEEEILMDIPTVKEMSLNQRREEAEEHDIQDKI